VKLNRKSLHSRFGMRVHCRSSLSRAFCSDLSALSALATSLRTSVRIHTSHDLCALALCLLSATSPLPALRSSLLTLIELRIAENPHPWKFPFRTHTSTMHTRSRGITRCICTIVHLCVICSLRETHRFSCFSSRCRNKRCNNIADIEFAAYLFNDFHSR